MHVWGNAPAAADGCTSWVTHLQQLTGARACGKGRTRATDAWTEATGSNGRKRDLTKQTQRIKAAAKKKSKRKYN